MLKFYGIRFNQNGAPERFSISFSLGESLHAGLLLLEEFNRDAEKTKKAIDKEIENLFQRGDSSKCDKRFRFLIAKWFRTKDIVNFLLADHSVSELKVSVAEVLDSREGIRQKWQKIEHFLIDYLLHLVVADRNEQLSNPESEFNLTLQMISLFFMEQDDEMPPANLELQFIRYQFPRIIWKKKDGFNSSSNPFWLPKNMYCRSSYLLAKIISKIYEQAENASEFSQSLHVVNGNGGATDPDLKQNAEVSISYSAMLPEDTPDEIRLELDESTEENQQMMIPESAAETLLSLQKMIQKRLSHDGVKHLLGIFRQLTESGVGGICEFDVSKHLKMVAKASKKGEFSKKQVSLFEQVFETISKIKVKRFWEGEDESKVTTNPFILELFAESDPSEKTCIVKKLLLDPLFLPGKDNPFHLGIHLRFIPESLFRETSHTHALLPGLASFLTGTWLNEFIAKRGKTSKTTREIVEGCAFNVTPASKYRIIDKVKSELAYMKEKCYISDYSYHQNEEGNPWDDLHEITASDSILADIAEKMLAVEAQSGSEKLIA